MPKVEGITGFNVRVYGLYISPSFDLLAIEEKHNGSPLLKFPGGGVEPGEGLIDALVREWQEETNLEIEVLRHYYTTDFFQRSFFKQSDQIISVYYLVKPINDLRVSELNVPANETSLIQFKWLSLTQLSPQHLTLPIDQRVSQLLIQDYQAQKLFIY